MPTAPMNSNLSNIVLTAFIIHHGVTLLCPFSVTTNVSTSSPKHDTLRKFNQALKTFLLFENVKL